MKWWGESEIHLHLLVLCSSGRGLIIYRPSDNWQHFRWAPPIHDEFVFFIQTPAQYTLAKCSQALSITARVAGRKKKKYHVTPDDRKALREEWSQIKILWNLMVFMSLCLELIDLHFSFFPCWAIFFHHKCDSQEQLGLNHWMFLWQHGKTSQNCQDVSVLLQYRFLFHRKCLWNTNEGQQN